MSIAGLRAFPVLLSTFGEGGRRIVEDGCVVQRLQPGARIFEQDEPADGLYFVEEGEVEVFLRQELREWQLATLGQGEVLGEMSLLDAERRRHACARAGKQGATLVHCSLRTIRELRKGSPEDFAQALMTLAGRVVDRLDKTNHKLVERLAGERAEGMQRDLVVHDLRSPLASIETGVSSLLQRADLYGPVTPKQRTALLRIGKNAAFLRLLIDSILEVERARMAGTQVRGTSLREVLTAIAPPLLSLVAPERWMAGDEQDEDSPLAAFQGTRLSLPPPEALARPLRADPLRLGQVLLNLIGNAIRYTEGPVELAAQAQADGLAIEVSDRGPGIPEDKRESIFDAFKRRELQNERLPVGKGFGLAGVREMVTSMGGTIAALGRADGTSGARFRVVLPAAGGTP